MNPIKLALSLALGLSLLTGFDAAAGWIPVSCEDRGTEIAAVRRSAGRTSDFGPAWRAYEQAVRKAAPGTPKYVPHPYPQSPQQVFENFRHALLTRLVQDPDHPEPMHRKTVEALRSGAFRYEVGRVENWDPTRCGDDHPAPFYHVVRLFDGGGHELSRTALHENGLFAIFSPLDGRQGPLDDLTKIAATVRQRFGIETRPSRVQYVSLSGLPVPCRPTMPCVAFQSAGRTFLVNHDFFLFAIEPNAPQLGVLELKQRPVDSRALSVNAGRPATPWITVGYGFQEGRLLAIGPRGGPLE